MLQQISLGLLIPFIAISGWWLRLRQRQKKTDDFSPVKPHRGYYIGLNYLINDEPDKAIGEFIKLLEVDTDTVEIHIALGSLFRRRGEVDRAIRIHQNLIARPNLEKIQRSVALAELGKDYMRAGFLDRAEALFQELVETGQKTESSLRFLLTIYEQEQDWHQAMRTATQIELQTGEDMGSMIAHYCCELAENNMQLGEYGESERLLKQALSADNNAVRANLIQGRLMMKQENFRRAIKALKGVRDQDKRYLSEAVPLLAECYQMLNREEALLEYLKLCAEDDPLGRVVVLLLNCLKTYRGNDEAAEFLKTHLKKYPSVLGLNVLLGLYVEDQNCQETVRFQALSDVVDKLLRDKALYRCEQCGFSGNTLYWHCPGCRMWGSAKPLHEVGSTRQ